MPDTVGDIEDVPAAKDTGTPSDIEEGLQHSLKDGAPPSAPISRQIRRGGPMRGLDRGSPGCEWAAASPAGSRRNTCVDQVCAISNAASRRSSQPYHQATPDPPRNIACSTRPRSFAPMGLPPLV